MYSNSGMAIETDAIGKCYKIFKRPSDRLKQALPWQKRSLYEEFWAVRDVSLQVERGQTVGIIGRNGSGKSTLLQLICGTLTATEGRVQVNGRIGALLELGSGFNPEFTGLENVRLNAAVLGLRKREIDEKIDQILDFADIGSFVGQPVKQYSSGMVVRLAFAVQAHLDPTVLIVDEALAVGDELFQKKCFTRLIKLKEQGTSILLVSHSCSQINQHCDKVILMSKGNKLFEGNTHIGTGLYQELLGYEESQWGKIAKEKLETGVLRGNDTDSKESVGAGTQKRLSGFDTRLLRIKSQEYDPRGGRITSITTSNQEGTINNVFEVGDSIWVKIDVYFSKSFESVHLGCFICNKEGRRISGQSYPENANQSINVEAGKTLTVRFVFSGCFWEGTYFIGAGVADSAMQSSFIHRVVDKAAFKVSEKYVLRKVGETRGIGHSATAEMT